jgi:hypothetical protein
MAGIDDTGGWLPQGRPRPFFGIHPPPMHGSLHAPLGAAPPSGPTPSADLSVGNAAPDFAGLLNADPGLVAWKAGAQGRMATLAAQRAAAIRSLALKYGGLPPGFTDAFGDLRPEDIQAGANNPFSADKQLQKNYDAGVAAMKASTSARGMLQSGELGYGQEQQDRAAATDRYNTGNDFLAALNSALGDNTGGVQGVNAEEPGVINAATSNVLAQHPVGAPIQAHLVDNWQQYGQPVYQGADGKLWSTNAETGAAEEFTPPAPSGRPHVPLSAVPNRPRVSLAGFGAHPHPLSGRMIE